ncbi:DUF4142 domain-containing protein [Pseudomonas aeruginosa]|uniref:DUF4142 domain-containing protein n=1 Tax=Pseudomonas aeruginosa TaxID=287 RepID=UPI0039F637D1
MRKQGGAALCQARTHRTAGVRPPVTRPGRGKGLGAALAAPDRTAGRRSRGFLDAQIRQQDRLVARFEGIARDSADPDLRRFADEWLARFYHHRELADQLRSGRAD